MTEDERARIQAKLDRIHAQLAELKAGEAERRRLKMKSRRSLERFHEAVVALREVTPSR